MVLKLYILSLLLLLSELLLLRLLNFVVVFIFHWRDNTWTAVKIPNEKVSWHFLCLITRFIGLCNLFWIYFLSYNQCCVSNHFSIQEFNNRNFVSISLAKKNKKKTRRTKNNNTNCKFLRTKKKYGREKKSNWNCNVALICQSGTHISNLPSLISLSCMFACVRACVYPFFMEKLFT